MNSNNVSRVTNMLVAIMKRSPHLMRLIKVNNLRNKLILHTSCKNRTSTSILIQTQLVSTDLRLL
jgi:hypothetical protein